MPHCSSFSCTRKRHFIKPNWVGLKPTGRVHCIHSLPAEEPQADKCQDGLRVPIPGRSLLSSFFFTRPRSLFRAFRIYVR
ncbi:hypothetical protein AGIG_G19077 [Arapaima gigas]